MEKSLYQSFIDGDNCIEPEEKSFCVNLELFYNENGLYCIYYDGEDGSMDSVKADTPEEAVEDFKWTLLNYFDNMMEDE